MAADTFDIQKLSILSGVPRRNIYFYVQQGLLPPPQGAGLAAFYTEDHLLRLKLIPLLRQQGLRLDDIRLRFTSMSIDEMRRQVSEANEPATQANLPPLVIQDGLMPPQPLQAVHEEYAPQTGWVEQNFIHYSLPLGITLTVPQEIRLKDGQRLNMLLRAAERIFTNPARQYIVHEPENPAADASSSASEEIAI